MTGRSMMIGAVLLALVAWALAPAGATDPRYRELDEQYIRTHGVAFQATLTTASTELVAAQGSGTRIVLVSFEAQSEGSDTLQLKTATTGLSLDWECTDGATWVRDMSLAPLRCGDNEALNATTGGAATINVGGVYVVWPPQ